MKLSLNIFVNELHYGGLMRVLRGTEVTSRLVQHEVNSGAVLQCYSIDLDMTKIRDWMVSVLGDCAIHSDAVFRQELPHRLMTLLGVYSNKTIQAHRRKVTVGRFSWHAK